MRTAQSFGKVGIIAVVCAINGCGGDVGDANHSKPGSGGAGGKANTFPTGGTTQVTGSGGARDAGLGTCEVYCSSQADCCTDCTYPNNRDCLNHRCVNLGCTSDADCARTDGPASVCRSVLGVPRCLAICRSDSDCGPTAPLCLGADDMGELFCGKLPGLILPCVTDANCATGICDSMTHRCGCYSDEECLSNMICVASG